MEAANLIEGERVQIWNVTNGETARHLCDPRPARAAVRSVSTAQPPRKAQVGDVLIIASYARHGVRGGEDVPPVGGLSRHGDQSSGRVE